MKQKDFAIILVPVFLLTVFWVIFSVYQSYTTSTITDPLTIQIVPIDGTFNRKAIDKLKNRDRIEPLYDIQIKEASTQQSKSKNASENQTILNQNLGGGVASQSSQTLDQTSSQSGVITQ